MSSVGWKVIKQVKDYGEYITATLDGDTLSVKIAPNPIGLAVSDGPLRVPATREVADRMCYVLNSLLEEVDTLQQSMCPSTSPKNVTSDPPI